MSDLINEVQRVPPFDLLSHELLESLVSSVHPVSYPLGFCLPSRIDNKDVLFINIDSTLRLTGPDPFPSSARDSLTYGLISSPQLVQPSLLPDNRTYRLTISAEGSLYSLNTDIFASFLCDNPALGEWYNSRLELAQLGSILPNILSDHIPQEPKPFRSWLSRLYSSSKVLVVSVSDLANLADDGVYFCLYVLPYSFPSGYSLPSIVGLPVSGIIGLGLPSDLNLRLIKLPCSLIGFTSNSSGDVSASSQHSDSSFTDPWSGSTTLPSSGSVLPKSSLVSSPPTSKDEAPEPPLAPESSKDPFPIIRAEGQVPEAVACFRMLGRALDFPLKADVLKGLLEENIQRSGSLSLQLCAAIAEYLGLQTQLASVPEDLIERVTTPSLVLLGDELSVLYAVRPGEVLLGSPREGLVKRSVTSILALCPEDSTDLPVLLLRTLPSTPKARFGIKWFIPSIKKNRRSLIEVLVASLFVQLFQLMNPLLIQQIIDKVIGQNGMNTLPVLGVLLVTFSFFENVLTTLRTNLFVETTNRIDLSLGEVIIDHLLKLPLSYFDHRPVGELSQRLGEMENIRSFLTGTALTVVLDSVFSVIYIAVMLVYSWILTIVALIVVPLLALITIGISPVVRGQLRSKAELNARTQSHLVEVLTGIQTVKAQNFELKARWRWKENYSRFVAEGFRNAMTSTTANSLTNFLNQLSGLLVLCVGAWLVLQGQLTLGGLIAFRIIAGYVTSPLLRLVQLWQTFQQTALSMERLADIVDTPQESELVDRTNIPMPQIDGKIIYEDLSFRFAKEGPLQLSNVSVVIEPGQFVGIVGQSGSGKSTLTKLLPRLYPALSGRIFIDGYDIAKVELYSLRRQIGIVPQESLLFEGTVQENIGLTNPEATSEEIIAAARIACAHDFIMQLPTGYNTPVGERGGTLSGGQRQRIAIARTVLQNPRILIMDEATSALDVATERRVCLNLMEALRGRTVLFITHRLNTIRSADRILLLHEGSLSEDGSHAYLMDLRGRYYALYRQQEASGEAG